ncbi:hypothetical protein [Streptomyces sp. NPDC097610]|uniref:hypothetical protein n=1 Tax=Streptomyces sp. NPDC097610 TaxID=3157227 RepID=UPI00331CA314
MGRWAGFCRGYQDLARLHLSYPEVGCSAQRVNFFEVFAAIRRDGRSLREELKRYSVLVDGRPQPALAKPWCGLCSL